MVFVSVHTNEYPLDSATLVNIDNLGCTDTDQTRSHRLTGFCTYNVNHYRTFAFISDRWIEFDDDRVSVVVSPDVLQ